MVEPGEDAQAAALRELHEEAQLLVREPPTLVGAAVRVRPGRHLTYVFQARLEQREPITTPGDECTATSWARPNMARNMVEHPGSRARLEVALATTSETWLNYRAYCLD